MRAVRRRDAHAAGATRDGSVARCLMPARAALIAVLITERPLCLPCITERAGLPAGDIHEYLARMRDHLTVLHDLTDRCRACGTVAEVFSLDRLPL